MCSKFGKMCFIFRQVPGAQVKQDRGGLQHKWGGTCPLTRDQPHLMQPIWLDTAVFYASLSIMHMRLHYCVSSANCWQRIWSNEGPARSPALALNATYLVAASNIGCSTVLFCDIVNNCWPWYDCMLAWVLLCCACVITYNAYFFTLSPLGKWILANWNQFQNGNCWTPYS